jgi:Flp pilus assembly pilin Flp
MKAFRRVGATMTGAIARARMGDTLFGPRRARRGQGTTEYAILVGVLVVIAIVAIIAFRDKVSEMWDAIASGINSL